MKRIYILIAALIVVVGVIGCQNTREQVSSVQQKNRAFVDGIGTSFIIPDEYKDFIGVDDYSAMKVLDGGYHYTSDDCETYVALKNGMFSVAKLTDVDYTDIEAIRTQLERLANIRIIQAESVSQVKDTHKHISKIVYKACIDGLFNAEFYGRFYGYISVIQTDTSTYCYIASNPNNLSEQDLVSAKSFSSSNYNTNINTEERSDKYKALELVDYGHAGDYVRASVLYRSDKTSQVDFGLCLTDHTAYDKDEINISYTPLKKLPDLEKGYHYEVANFLIDTQGYDVSQDMPDIRLRLLNEDGELYPNGGRTYILNMTSTNLCLLCVVKDNDKFAFQVGLERTVITTNYDASKTKDNPK